MDDVEHLRAVSHAAGENRAQFQRREAVDRREIPIVLRGFRRCARLRERREQRGEMFGDLRLRLQQTADLTAEHATAIEQP
ncbi:MAG: hypothetical protein HC802_14530 [Caldilineaceae bacterium]|nr:hypothetical protein [Caldilineaceae bacterium]